MFEPSEDGEYQVLELPELPGVVAWAVSLEFPGGIIPARRRVGFFYAIVGIDGRQLAGPSEEMLPGLQGQPPALHLLEFSWLGAYVGLVDQVEGYGVVVAPDRGAYPVIARLWGLT